MRITIFFIALFALITTSIAATPTEEAVTAARKAIEAGQPQAAAAYAAAARDLAMAEQIQQANRIAREIGPEAITAIKIGKIVAPQLLAIAARSADDPEDKVVLGFLSSLSHRVVTHDTKGLNKEVKIFIKNWQKQSAIANKKFEEEMASLDRKYGSGQ